MKLLKKICCLALAAALLLAAAGCDPGTESSSSGEESSMDQKEHYVGVTYSTWFPVPYNMDSTELWGTPLMGSYSSYDKDVINQHADWLIEYGADFIVIDWTNNINYVQGATDRPDLQSIELATDRVFEVFAERVQQGKATPKIVIASGIDTQDKAEAFSDGRQLRKLDQIWNDYYGNDRYSHLVFEFEGKPLVMMYLSTGSAFECEPEEIFTDDRVTIRFFTGFLGNQPRLLVQGTRISRYGYWSWWERGNNAYAVNEDGSCECVTISAAWLGNNYTAAEMLENPNAPWYADDAMGRRNGDTFREQWDLAIGLDAEIVIVQSFNEWCSVTMPGKAAEELDAEHSNDIEPSEEHGFLYLEIMKEKAALLKS